MNLIVSQTCSSFEHKLIFIAMLVTLSLTLYIFSTDVPPDKETGDFHIGSLIYRSLSGIILVAATYMLYKFCI